MTFKKITNQQKQELMNDLIEMETFKADVGDEGIILQKDLKKYFIFKMQEYHNFCKLWMNCTIGCTVFFN